MSKITCNLHGYMQVVLGDGPAAAVEALVDVKIG